MIDLAERFKVLPSQIVEEPLEWIVKIRELDYHRAEKPKLSRDDHTNVRN